MKILEVKNCAKNRAFVDLNYKKIEFINRKSAYQFIREFRLVTSTKILIKQQNAGKEMENCYI